MVIFDKTGTLTVGRPIVTHVLINPKLPPDDVSQNLVIEIAGAVEQGSEHPLGQAVRCSLPRAQSYTSHVLETCHVYTTNCAECSRLLLFSYT